MTQNKCVAVIGCGTISNNAHFPRLAGDRRIRIKYACDLILERAEAACKKYGAEKAVTDYREVLKDPEVEACFVLTPNFAHAVISIACLEAGKHVLCEKPITVNYALAQKMADAAEKAGKILDIGVCNRYNRSVNLIKDHIDAGRLGEVYHVYCSFRSYRSIPGLGGDFTTKSVAGGGVLIDWGVHFIDLILYVLGLPKVTAVTADTYCKLGKDIKNYAYTSMWAGPPKLDGVYDVDDMVSGYIRTQAASISFNGAWAQNIAHDEMYVDFMGDKGGVRLNYGQGFTFYTVENGILQTVVPAFEVGNHFEGEHEGFFSSIESGQKSRNNITFVLETAKILDAVYRSGEQKKEILL